MVGMTSDHPRISARISAIAESATLAVDAKAKALKAAGRPVIGFGAGEPDFPTPGYIVEAAQRACAVPRFHKYTPTPGLPELREAVAAKTARDSGYQVSAGQVLITNGGKQAVYETFATLLDPGDEVLHAHPVLDHLPRGDLAGRRRPGAGADRRADRVPGRVADLEAARTDRHQGAAVRVPVQPDRRGVPAGAGGRDRPVGRGARPLGGHRRDLRAPRLRRRHGSPPCRWWRRRSRTPAWCSTGWPRPTR